MIVYFDSSALVKRYLKESGTDRVQQAWTGAREVAISRVGYAEVLAAFDRQWREGHITHSGLLSATAQFSADWPGMIRLAVHEDLNPIVAALVARRPLRGFDAIHLASALHLKTQLGGPKELSFLCADKRLLQAAKAEGLETVPCP
jgi:predicted nucleic acid-binding protein